MAVFVLTILLYVFNVVQVLLSSIIGGTAIWTFIEVIRLVSSDRSIVNAELRGVKWPEVLPWFFIIAAISTILTSVASFCCLSKKSRSLVILYEVFQVICVLLWIAASVTTALNAFDNDENKNFIETALWDSFHNNVHDDLKRFNALESKYHCCGATEPGNYGQSRFPTSCCKDGKPCDLNNSYANRLSGCIPLLQYYATQMSWGLCIGAYIMAVIGFFSVIIAVVLCIFVKKSNKKFSKTEVEKLNPSKDCQQVII